jgi:hypothetical protein
MKKSRKAVLFLQKQNQKNACQLEPRGLHRLGLKGSKVFLLLFLQKKKSLPAFIRSSDCPAGHISTYRRRKNFAIDGAGYE